ncbi:hypothetical protein HYH46_14885 [Clostridium botulinum]|nr:hypothetical protein [Clostridium botulinum]
MTEIEKRDWNELCEYVKKEILGYDNGIKIPKFLILRLKGLKDGKFICNNKTKSLANYTYYEILTTFKVNKILIKNSILPVSKFKDEQHRINYIMAIIENKINDVAVRIREVKLSEIKSNNIEINICNNKATYVKKTKEVKNSRLKGLL